ncbi:MAG: hypothetical protein WCO08_04955 [Actinomycetes bacterium]
MKRGLLIATGTIGGLGVVFAITPPQFGGGTLGGGTLGGGTLGSSTGALSSGTTASASPITSTTPTPIASSTPTHSSAGTTPVPKSTKKSATKKATPKATPKKTKTTGTGTKATGSTPTPVASSAAPTPTKATSSGSFTGSAVSTRYGTVQVQITVTNGKITAARGVQMPARDFRSQQISQQAEVYLVQETLAANSANIQGVGGASYTSQGWQQSLASAVAQAGL